MFRLWILVNVKIKKNISTHKYVIYIEFTIFLEPKLLLLFYFNCNNFIDHILYIYKHITYYHLDQKLLRSTVTTIVYYYIIRLRNFK